MSPLSAVFLLHIRRLLWLRRAVQGDAPGTYALHLIDHAICARYSELLEMGEEDAVEKGRELIRAATGGLT